MEAGEKSSIGPRKDQSQSYARPSARGVSTFKALELRPLGAYIIRVFLSIESTDMMLKRGLLGTVILLARVLENFQPVT